MPFARIALLFLIMPNSSWLQNDRNRYHNIRKTGSSSITDIRGLLLFAHKRTRTHTHIHTFCIVFTIYDYKTAMNEYEYIVHIDGYGVHKRGWKFNRHTTIMKYNLLTKPTSFLSKNGLGGSKIRCAVWASAYRCVATWPKKDAS